MLIHLHKQATTTPKVRAAIQASTETAPVLAERFGVTEQTKGGRFRPGHDQKLRAAIEDAAGGLESLRAIVKKHTGRAITTSLSDD